MNAKDFGAFLARTRKACGLTQADLAAQLHVTDKAVSRWERGVGLPDINTLEPLADALGLTLSDLMHCRDPQEAPLPNAEPTLEDFLTMLRRPHSIDWHSVRAALLCLSILAYASTPVFLPFTGTALAMEISERMAGCSLS